MFFKIFLKEWMLIKIYTLREFTVQKVKGLICSKNTQRKITTFNLIWVETIKIYLVCAMFINSNLG